MRNEVVPRTDVAEAPGGPANRRAARTDGVVGTVTLALAAALVPAVATSAWLGAEPYTALHRDFPGIDVALTVAALRAVAELASVLTVGALVALLFLDGAARTVPPRGVALVTLRASSLCWATAAGLLILFGGLDAAGIGVDQLDQPGAWSYVYAASYPPKAWTVTALAAVLVAGIAQLAQRWTTLLLALWAAGGGVLAPVVVGQVLVGRNHDFGSDAGAIQALAVAAALGALLVVAADVGTGRLVPLPVLRRLVRSATTLLPVILACEIVLAWFKLAGTGIASSVTGWQIVARLGCLLLLSAVVARLMIRARSGRLRESHLAGSAVAVTLLVAGWCGITAAMTRVPPPHYFVETSIQEVFFGFEVVAPIGAHTLLTHWRANLLFCVIAATGVFAYLAGVRRLRARGDAWPVGRGVAWVCGCLVLAVATSSGVGRYSGADLGVHMGVHMALAMLAPLLLVLGGPVTLALRALPATGTAHSWVRRALRWRALRVLQQPIVVLVIFVGSYYALYLSEVFESAVRFHWAHQLMNLHFLISGYLYYGLVIGVDRTPTVLPPVGKLAYLMAAMPFHAFFGVILMTSDRLVAQNFYRQLGLPWADLEATQQLAGGIAWAGGELPLIVVIVVLGVQWARQDEREARRRDRSADSGLDDELDEYNRMLDQLRRRDRPPSPTTNTNTNTTGRS